MKQTVRSALKYLFFGVSFGCTFFVIMCLSYFILNKEELLQPIFKDFAKQSIGAMIVGVACGGVSIVYQFDRPGILFKLIIHFCVGMGVFYPTGIYLGWIPFYPERIIYTVLQFLCSCGVFMAIWFCFYLSNRNEAKKINKRLRELEQNNARRQT